MKEGLLTETIEIITSNTRYCVLKISGRVMFFGDTRTACSDKDTILSDGICVRIFCTMKVKEMFTVLFKSSVTGSIGIDVYGSGAYSSHTISVGISSGRSTLMV